MANHVAEGAREAGAETDVFYRIGILGRSDG